MGRAGTVAQAQGRGSGIADADVIVVLGGNVPRAEMNFHLIAGTPAHSRTGEGAVQKFDPVEIGGHGDSGDFRGHGLIPAVHDEPLR